MKKILILSLLLSNFVTSAYALGSTLMSCNINLDELTMSVEVTQLPNGVITVSKTGESDFVLTKDDTYQVFQDKGEIFDFFESDEIGEIMLYVWKIKKDEVKELRMAMIDEESSLITVHNYNNQQIGSVVYQPSTPAPPLFCEKAMEGIDYIYNN